MNITKLPNRKFNNKLAPEVGSKIKRAREMCGLSQVELAKLMGFKTGVVISLYESNKRQINAVDLWKVSQITNCPITFFL